MANTNQTLDLKTCELFYYYILLYYSGTASNVLEPKDIKYNNPIPNLGCAICGKNVTTEYHHIIPKSFCPMLARCNTNIIPLCSDCHTKGVIWDAHSLLAFQNYSSNKPNSPLLWEISVNFHKHRAMNLSFGIEELYESAKEAAICKGCKNNFSGYLYANLKRSMQNNQSTIPLKSVIDSRIKLYLKILDPQNNLANLLNSYICNLKDSDFIRDLKNSGFDPFKCFVILSLKKGDIKVIYT